MTIEYLWCKEFDSLELGELFRSVGWSSGEFPNELKQAMLGSHSVLSAWEEGRLIGLMNALSDGVMTVYFHYLLVHPDYQGQGIGKRLVADMLERYDGCLRKMLVSYDQEVGFYMRCGFAPGDGKTPMYITSLTT